MNYKHPQINPIVEALIILTAIIIVVGTIYKIIFE